MENHEPAKLEKHPDNIPPAKRLKIRGAVVRMLRVAILSYVGVCAVFFCMQRSLLFPGAPPPSSTPRSMGLPFEEFHLSVGGESTHGWRISVENARGTVIFSHGNAARMDDLYTAGIFASLGFNVVQYAYGGYGNSTGKTSEKRCYNDIRAVWKWLTEEKGEKPERIVLAGRSLGGAVTAQLAGEVSPAAVILESTLTSTADAAGEMLPWLPVYPLVLDRFNSAGKMVKIHAPVLVIHSPYDTLINYRLGRRLFELANEPKSFLELHGDHNEGFFIDRNNYTNGLKKFLDGVFK